MFPWMVGLMAANGVDKRRDFIGGPWLRMRNGAGHTAWTKMAVRAVRVAIRIPTAPRIGAGVQGRGASGSSLQNGVFYQDKRFGDLGDLGDHGSGAGLGRGLVEGDSQAVSEGKDDEKKSLGKVSATYPPIVRAKPWKSYLKWKLRMEFWNGGG